MPTIVLPNSTFCKRKTATPNPPASTEGGEYRIGGPFGAKLGLDSSALLRAQNMTVQIRSLLCSKVTGFFYISDCFVCLVPG